MPSGPTVVQLIPAPHSRTCWPMREPSLETNAVRVDHAWLSASATATPASRMVAVTPTSRSVFSDIATSNGSSTHRLDQLAVTAGTPTRSHRRPGHRGRGAGDGRRPLAGAAHRGVTVRVADRGEAPRGAHQRPHPQAGRGGLRQRAHVAVARGDRLVAAVDQAGVGVARTGGQRGLDRGARGVEGGRGDRVGVVGVGGRHDVDAPGSAAPARPVAPCRSTPRRG